ncbi:hypothetical protein ACNIU1_26280, partial [Escherichia coli]
NHKYTLEDLMASGSPYSIIFSQPSPLRQVPYNNYSFLHSSEPFVSCKEASLGLKDKRNFDTNNGGKTWHYYLQQIFCGRP